MYKILGADHKEYGPVAFDPLVGWIKEGRANESTLAQAEGTAEWKPLYQFPEFAPVLAAKAVTPPPFPGNAPAPAGGKAPLQTVLARDYDLELGGCISRGFNVFKENMGLILGTWVVYVLIEIVFGLLSLIPLIGAVFNIANFIISGPLMAGCYYVMLRSIRKQPAEVGDLFYGFRTGFAQFMLGNVVKTLLSMVAGLPGAGIAALGLIPLSNDSTPLAVLLFSIGGIIALIPVLYLQVSWAFTIPLIMDREMDFWAAMSASRKMVGKHFFIITGLLILIGLLYLAGVCCCFVGSLFTLPIGFCAFMCAYETIFSEPAVTPAATSPTLPTPTV